MRLKYVFVCHAASWTALAAYLEHSSPWEFGISVPLSWPHHPRLSDNSRLKQNRHFIAIRTDFKKNFYAWITLRQHLVKKLFSCPAGADKPCAEKTRNRFGARFTSFPSPSAARAQAQANT